VPARPTTEGYQVPPGPSILDKLWDEMVFQISKMYAANAETERAPGDVRKEADARAQQGHCLGLAKAIAIILNPYDPDINEVRREAMRRYREGRG
jgi:hypothetical protein